MLYSILLILALKHATSIDFGDFPSDEWEDVTSALSVFNSDGDPKYKGIDQQCNACTFLGQQILNGWIKYGSKLKKWKLKKKIKKATRAVEKSCKRYNKMQICLTDKGFDDFNVLMQTGIISNVNMDGSFATHLKQLCAVSVPRLLDYGLPLQMADVDRIYDFNLQLELCQKIIPACGKKKKKKKDNKKDKGNKRTKGSKKKKVYEATMTENEEEIVNMLMDDVSEEDTIEL